MNQENIPLENVKQHYDWSRKDCPQQIRQGREGIDWATFLGMVNQFFLELKGEKVATPVKEQAKPNDKRIKSVDKLAQEVLDGKHGDGDARKKSLGNRFNEVQQRVNQLLSNPDPKKPVLKPLHTIAQEVLEGKWGNNPQRQHELSNAGYNASEVQKIVNDLAKPKATPKPAAAPTPKPTPKPKPAAPKKKSLDVIAQEVIEGKWGNGSDRRSRLNRAGYDFNAVQSRVNAMSNSTNVPVKKTVDQVVQEILNGQGGWGNNPNRAVKLRRAGYNAAHVQNKVNQALRKR